MQDVVGDGEIIAKRFELEDRDAGLEVGRLHVDDEARAEPAAQPLFDAAQLLWRAVACDDDLALVLVQVVERVEELGLGLLGAGEELDVVQEQDVHVPVLTLELVAAALADRLDELRHEALGGDVAHPRAGRELPHVVRHGEQQMGLAQAHAPVDEDRVVRARGGSLGDGERRGMGELVARARDERLERVSVGEGRRRQGLVQRGLVCRGHRGIGLPRLDRFGRTGAQPYAHPGAEGIPDGSRDQVHVMAGEPSLDVGARRDELEHATREVARGELGEPELVRGLREILSSALANCRPRSSRGRFGGLRCGPISNRTRHLSTGTFHSCGIQRARSGGGLGAEPVSRARGL